MRRIAPLMMIITKIIILTCVIRASNAVYLIQKHFSLKETLLLHLLLLLLLLQKLLLLLLLSVCKRSGASAILLMCEAELHLRVLQLRMQLPLLLTCFIGVGALL
jgi:hypothetical protein